MTSVSRCKFCGKELPMRNCALPGHKPFMVPDTCTCEQAQEEEMMGRRELEKGERMRVCMDVWQRSGVPKRFADVKPDFNRVGHLMDNKWIYFCGDNGRGKTFAACQVAKAYLVRNTKRERFVDVDGKIKDGVMLCPSFRFIASPEILSEISSSWSRWDQNEEEVLSRWAGVDLLILDDLGKGSPSEWAAEKIFDIINRRWGDEKLTIITSQYEISELADRYDKAGKKTLGALISRLKGECHKVTMDGPDMRLS